MSQPTLGSSAPEVLPSPAVPSGTGAVAAPMDGDDRLDAFLAATQQLQGALHRERVRNRELEERAQERDQRLRSASEALQARENELRALLQQARQLKQEHDAQRARAGEIGEALARSEGERERLTRAGQETETRLAAMRGIEEQVRASTEALSTQVRASLTAVGAELGSTAQRVEAATGGLSAQWEQSFGNLQETSRAQLQLIGRELAAGHDAIQAAISEQESLQAERQAELSRRLEQRLTEITTELGGSLARQTETALSQSLQSLVETKLTPSIWQMGQSLQKVAEAQQAGKDLHAAELAATRTGVERALIGIQGHLGELQKRTEESNPAAIARRMELLLSSHREFEEQFKGVMQNLEGRMRSQAAENLKALVHVLRSEVSGAAEAEREGLRESLYRGEKRAESARMEADQMRREVQESGKIVVRLESDLTSLRNQLAFERQERHRLAEREAALAATLSSSVSADGPSGASRSPVRRIPS